MAPDYILVHRDDEKRLLAMLTDVDRAFRTSVGGAPRAVVNARHYERLKGLMTETGGEVVVGGMSSGDKLGGVVPPTVVSRPNPNSSLMKEEVFGPVLSVLAVDSLDAAVEVSSERQLQYDRCASLIRERWPESTRPCAPHVCTL